VSKCVVILGCLAAATAAVLGAPSAVAATVPDPYETVQPVETSRDAAFVDALKTVVVRVSGRRDAALRLGSDLNSPSRYVQRFGYTADGLLQVRFDSVSIDRLLSQAGLPIWGHERPAVLVLLQTPADEAAGRDIIAKAAYERGLPLKWPGVQGMTDGDLQDGTGGDTAAALQAAGRYGANAVLFGRLHSGAVDWTLAFSDGEVEVSGGWNEGVHLAADTFARMFAVSGSTLDSLALEVSGIGDLDAYASTLNYLEGMTLVRSVALEQVIGDTMHFRVAVRGDAATLRRAIALDDKLVPRSGPGASSDSATNLAFRYRP